MNQCSITDCSDNNTLYTGNKVTINSKNFVTIKYESDIIETEIVCIACSNTEEILKSKITLIGQNKTEIEEK